MELITQIIEICIIPLLGILTKYLISFLSAKRDETKAKTESDTTKKYLDMIYKTIEDCVTATNQTYVESLKAQGAFDAEAQKEAFHKTLDAVMSILTEDAKEFIVETTGDITVYLTQLIEAQVHAQK